jgi:tRNA/rRNA methyltransferase
LQPEQLLARIRVVLCQTTHPGNIGSTARAMKTMGLRDLVLVRPKRFPDPEADALSSNALDVLGAARVVETLAEALQGTVLAVATVSHAYDLSHGLVTCREAAADAFATARSGDVALVFGTEASGLTADEVRLCSVCAWIPGNPDYNSLNLAAAVQIFAYETRLAAFSGFPAPDEVPDLASHDEIERLHAHLAAVLEEIGFLDPANPKRLVPRLRRMVARARLEQVEVQILRGLLTTLQERKLLPRPPSANLLQKTGTKPPNS